MSVHRGPVTAAGRRGWVVRWRDVDTGRQRQRTFRRRSDADQWDAELRRRRAWGPSAVRHLTGGGVTLDEWRTDRWEPEHAATRLERATCDVYQAVHDRHIAPLLGDVALADLTPSRIRAWQGRLVAADVGGPTIRKARTALGSVLSHAAGCDAIASNPIAAVPAPRRGMHTAVRPVELAGVEAIRAQLLASSTGRRGLVDRWERQRDATLISLLALAGLRPGEARGLRWRDIGRVVVTVERAIGVDGAVKSTKTRHIGTVRLLPGVIEDLDRLAAVEPSGHRSPSSWVLDGLQTPASWSAWRRDRWVPACAAAELDPRPRAYDLRHTFASLLLADGRQVHDVARQLRHTPVMTLNTYGHLFDDIDGGAGFDLDTELTNARAEAERAAGLYDPAQEG